MSFICKYCGKELKTESGFKKHSCRYIKRLNDPLSQESYKLFLKFMNTKVHNKQLKTDFDSYIMNKYYNDFHNLILKFAEYEENGIKELWFDKFYEYCLTCNALSKNWCKDSFFEGFISDYIFKEDKNTAIKRSEEYIKTNNINFNNISENMLYILLKFGLVSPYYIKDKKINVKELLGLDLQENIKYIIKLC